MNMNCVFVFKFSEEHAPSEDGRISTEAPSKVVGLELTEIVKEYVCARAEILRVTYASLQNRYENHLRNRQKRELRKNYSFLKFKASAIMATSFMPIFLLVALTAKRSRQPQSRHSNFTGNKPM
jgi:hypothetical protein